jgi:hypothetical protein
MPMGSKKSDDPDSDKRHKRAKSDDKKVEHSHDAPGESLCNTPPIFPAAV